MKVTFALGLLLLIGFSSCSSISSILMRSSMGIQRSHATDQPENLDNVVLAMMNEHYYGFHGVYPDGYLDKYGKVLVAVAFADGEFSNKEKNALAALAWSANYATEKILALFTMDVSGVNISQELKSMEGDTQANARMLFADAAYVAAADDLNKNEGKALRQIAKTLKIPNEIAGKIAKNIQIQNKGRVGYISALLDPNF